MKQIVAWVNKREQNRIEKLNKRYNLNFVFVNNFKDFVKGIQPDTISLLLRRKANTHFRKLNNLLVEYPNRTFYAYVEHDAPCTLPKEFYWATEKNVKVCDETDIMVLLKSL
ncbi:hypothetical protein R84B8_02511 [Treponema sp. R8-4-B8]